MMHHHGHTRSDQHVKFTFSSKPFPYIIIDNTFSKEGCEYSSIWKELYFHANNALTPSEYAGAKDEDGTFMSTAKALILDDLYSGTFRKLSNILTIKDRMFFNTEIYNKFHEQDPYWITYKESTRDVTKIRKYSVGDGYKPHCDFWVNALISTTLCSSEDEGGNLIFPEHDFEIETKDNRTVIIPGWIKHGVSKIVKNDRYAITTFVWCEPS